MPTFETPQQSDPGVVGKTQDTYYAQVLSGIGAPVTQANLNALKAWQQAEGSTARWNAFNTTQPSKTTGTSNYNSVGVKNYPTQKTGVDATVNTLKLSYYVDMVKALKNNDQEAFIQALVASPWDGGYSGRGNGRTYKQSSVYSRFMAINGNTGTTAQQHATHGAVTHAGVQHVDTGTIHANSGYDFTPTQTFNATQALGLGGITSGTERLVRILTDGQFWIRVIQMTLGGVVIIWGVTSLAGNQLGLSDLKSGIKGVIPV
jgi:hypothetical protein